MPTSLYLYSNQQQHENKPIFLKCPYKFYNIECYEYTEPTRLTQTTWTKTITLIQYLLQQRQYTWTKTSTISNICYNKADPIHELSSPTKCHGRAM